MFFLLLFTMFSMFRPASVVSAVIWLMIAYTTRYSSAAALSAAIAAPFAGLLFLGPTFAVGVLAGGIASAAAAFSRFARS